MRKVLIAGMLVFLVACGSKTYYVTEVAPTTEAPATTKPARTTTTMPRPVYTTQPRYNDSSYDDRMFVASVHELYSDRVYTSDQELIKTGRLTCSALQSGMTANELYESLLSASGYDPSMLEFLSVVAASAIAWYCPDQAWKLG